MKPLSKALRPWGALVLVILGGASMTGLDLWRVPLPREPERDPETVSPPVVTPSQDPTAEPANSTEPRSVTTSGSAAPPSPCKSNTDRVPARGDAPEFVAPGVRFVVGAEPAPEPMEPIADAVTPEATPESPARSDRLKKQSRR